MIIVSNGKAPNSAVDKNEDQLITYDYFLGILLSDEGFVEEGPVVININDIKDTEYYKAEEIFEVLVAAENIKFFSTDQTAPEFSADIVDEIHDWFVEDENEEWISAQDEEEILSHMSPATKSAAQENITNLMNQALEVEDDSNEDVGGKEAQIVVFGSSKGGTGKTFTSIMSTYRYARTHPNKRIALVDFDLIDGQVGISIHQVKPTMRNYYTSYMEGMDDFNTMRNFAVSGNDKYPSNVDFYLAPSSGEVVRDDKFWFNVIKNLVENYDLVVFDTGIDYLNIRPIAYAYMSADKINLVTTTSIKSVTSVRKQISKLRGDTPNNTYTKENNIAPRLNVIITQMIPEDEMNKTVYENLRSKANVVATFGVITEQVSRAEFFGEWDVFENNKAINDAFDKIMSLE